MGRKKRDITYLKPFCYYCDKTFEDEITLHSHQKAKHFTCTRCNKKFSTADSLKVHMTQSHNREQLQKIPGANPTKDSVELKIFGMHGVPRQYVMEKALLGAAQYWNKFIAEREQIKKKELKKEKQAQKEAQRLLNQERNIQNPSNNYPNKNIQLQDSKYSNFMDQQQQNKPISFNISMNTKLKTQDKQKPTTLGFDEEDNEF